MRRFERELVVKAEAGIVLLPVLILNLNARIWRFLLVNSEAEASPIFTGISEIRLYMCIRVNLKIAIYTFRKL